MIGRRHLYFDIKDSLIKSYMISVKYNYKNRHLKHELTRNFFRFEREVMNGTDKREEWNGSKREEWDGFKGRVGRNQERNETEPRDEWDGSKRGVGRIQGKRRTPKPRCVCIVQCSVEKYLLLEYFANVCK